MRETTEKLEWGQIEKIGKGTKANYNAEKKVLTFCFNRGPETSSELLRTSREHLMKELTELGYVSRMKYNGEVVVDNVQESDLVLVKNNHKLVITLNKKQDEKVKTSSESIDSKNESQSQHKIFLNCPEISNFSI